MLAALAAPERVSRLVVVDIAPVPYNMGGNRGVLDALRGATLKELTTSHVHQRFERLALRLGVQRGA